jgi:hypothetical protein
MNCLKKNELVCISLVFKSLFYDLDMVRASPTGRGRDGTFPNN